MISHRIKKKKEEIPVADHPATRAWQRLCTANGRPNELPLEVETLKRQRGVMAKSGVWRLLGVGDDASAVVAKRCLQHIAVVERHVYEHLLPNVPLSALRYYGYLPEADSDYCWFFIEDAGDFQPCDEDRVLAAQWLAQLHGSAASLRGKLSLPERGPGHYLEHLQAANRHIKGMFSDGSLLPEDEAAFRVIQPLLDDVEANWDRICRGCYAVPWTVVHGDFVEKNTRVRCTGGRRTFIAMDWETAGWGPPAADLARWPRRSAAFGGQSTENAHIGMAAFDAYLATAEQYWPGVSRQDMEQVARTGTLFRLLAGLRWACEQLGAGGFKGSVRVQVCADCLPAAIAGAMG